ncbi:chemokine XC receptor 1-like [Protopterus annectens]|uniref:chemokine XC receptor 1-like n=1 Tax=Protopterus annectens TaxID=7888 RepID=UPI001CFA0312|nr:chemokine XC receptor 1-like [Protopterus annectens]
MASAITTKTIYQTDFILESFTSVNDSFMYEGSGGELCIKSDVNKITAVLTAVFYSLITFLGLTGNSLVLFILLKYESLVSVTNIFILNLSVSDLISCLSLPFWATYESQGWIFGDVLCKVVSADFSVGFYSGIIFLTMMTIHRCIVVISPLAEKPQRSCYGILFCSIAWVTSIVVSTPEFILFNTETQENTTYCTLTPSLFWKLFGTYQQNIFFVISFTIILFCYAKILKTLGQTHSQRKKKTIKLIFVIVIVFFMTWTPYNVIIFLKSLRDLNVWQLECEDSKQIDYAFYICRNIAFSQCCINPILYAFVGVKFRKHLLKLLGIYVKCVGKDHASISKSYNRISYYSDDHSLY